MESDAAVARYKGALKVILPHFSDWITGSELPEGMYFASFSRGYIPQL